MFGHDCFGFNGYGITNQIFNAAGTAGDFTGDKVKIFQHCMSDENFSDGWKMELGEGDYDSETLTADGKNDQISALWIPEGYTVVASENYSGDATTGKQMTWVGPLVIECLADSTYGFNDDISNLKITYVDPTNDANESNCSATNNKVLSDSGDCSCMPGYTIDESDSTGPCIKDNTFLYMGIGAALLGIVLFTK